MVSVHWLANMWFWGNVVKFQNEKVSEYDR